MCICRLKLFSRLLAVFTSQLMTCIGYPTHVPITVFESLFAYHFTQPPPALPTPPQPPNTNPYRIHVSNESYTRDGQLTVTVNGTKGFKVSLGFLLRSSWWKIVSISLSFFLLTHIILPFVSNIKSSVSWSLVITSLFLYLCGRDSYFRRVLQGIQDLLVPFRGTCLRTKPICGVPVESHR